MKWYNTLTIHQKIQAKAIFILACGVEFADLAFMFTLKERIDILYGKLQSDGILPSN